MSRWKQTPPPSNPLRIGVLSGPRSTDFVSCPSCGVGLRAGGDIRASGEPCLECGAEVVFEGPDPDEAPSTPEPGGTSQHNIPAPPSNWEADESLTEPSQGAPAAPAERRRQLMADAEVAEVFRGATDREVVAAERRNWCLEHLVAGEIRARRVPTPEAAAPSTPAVAGQEDRIARAPGER